MTHDQLCERAAAWLRSTGRCNPVLTGIASCFEIPDAIGWNLGGSIVVECKTSRVDFLRDRKKYTRLRHPDGWSYKYKRLTKKRAIEMGCVEEPIANMGDRRYFLCPPEVASIDDVAKFYPDHGLLHAVGRRVRTMRAAPERKHISHKAEIRYLRFALIHVRCNLEKNGFVVNLCKLTQFFGEDGIVNPQTQKAADDLDAFARRIKEAKGGDIEGMSEESRGQGTTNIPGDPWGTQPSRGITSE